MGSTTVDSARADVAIGIEMQTQVMREETERGGISISTQTGPSSEEPASPNDAILLRSQSSKVIKALYDDDYGDPNILRIVKHRTAILWFLGIGVTLFIVGILTSVIIVGIPVLIVAVPFFCIGMFGKRETLTLNSSTRRISLFTEPFFPDFCHSADKNDFNIAYDEVENAEHTDGLIRLNLKSGENKVLFKKSNPDLRVKQINDHLSQASVASSRV